MNFLEASIWLQIKAVNTYCQYVLIITNTSFLNSDGKQMRKKSVHPFQSTDNDVKKEVNTENLMTNLSNSYASGMDAINKCYLIGFFLSFLFL